MTPTAFREMILDPGLAFLANATDLRSDDRACVLLMAIAGQESERQWRRQIGGPARGFWQFERSGGVRGVLTHHATAARAVKLCAALAIPPDEATVYEALAWSDHLAVGFARLLLWSDPRALPSVGTDPASRDAAWSYYERNWRPGKPRPEKWSANWVAAAEAIAP